MQYIFGSAYDILITYTLFYFLSFLYSGIGGYFVNDGMYTRILAGLTVNATIITVLASFYSGFIQYYIAMAIVFSSISLLRNISVYRIKINFTKYLLPYIGGLLLMLVFIEPYNSQHESIPFDGHMAYFSGVPLEMLNSEYFSRLRVFDNYPVEWSKYHFFNGSLSAQIMFFYNENNYFTFVASKVALLFILISSIVENIKISDKSLLTLLTLFFVTLVIISGPLLSSFKWNFSTNGYTSIGYIILAILFLQRDKYIGSMFFILAFIAVVSRSIIPGSLLLLSLLIIRKEILLDLYKNNKTLLSSIFILFSLSILSTVFIGESSSSILRYGLDNMLNRGWIIIMSAASAPKSALILSIIVLFLSLSTFLKRVEVNKNKILSLYEEHKSKVLIFLVASTSFVVFVILLNHRVPTSYSVNEVLYLFFIFYFMPMCLLYVLTPAKIRVFVFVFVVSSVLSTLVISADISIPNYALVEWIIFLFIIQKVADENIFVKCSVVLVSLLFFYYLYQSAYSIDIFSAKEPPIYIDYITEEELNLKNKEAFCSELSIDKSPIVAIFGHRVTYSKEKSDALSVSNWFINPSKSDMVIISDICNQ